VRFFDTALRVDLRTDADLANLAYFGLKGAQLVSEQGTSADSADRVIHRFSTVVRRAIEVAVEHELETRVALALAADAAPRRAHPEVRAAVDALAAAGKIAAIGPVPWPGPSPTAGWQFDVAASRGLAVVAEVRPHSGTAPLDSLVAEVAARGVSESKLLVFGADFTNIRTVIDRGLHWVADLSPAGLGWEAAAELVERHGGPVARRMMLSISSHASFDVLAAARFAERLRNGSLEPSAVDRILWGNAAAAFGLR
jgi:predicted metal-dependent TIM-barrel fold hydrolase